MKINIKIAWSSMIKKQSYSVRVGHADISERFTITGNLQAQDKWIFQKDQTLLNVFTRRQVNNSER